MIELRPGTDVGATDWYLGFNSVEPANLALRNGWSYNSVLGRLVWRGDPPALLSALRSATVDAEARKRYDRVISAITKVSENVNG